MPKEKPVDTQLANNRQAFHNYQILEQYEAGIVLTGAEVKSCRAKQINIKPAYIAIENGEAILKNSNIAPYKAAADLKYDPNRYRKLLLNRVQLDFLAKQVGEKGMTLLPISVYLKKGKIKVSVGLGQGKQLHDKRQDMKRKDQNREIQRHFRRG